MVKYQDWVEPCTSSGYINGWIMLLFIAVFQPNYSVTWSLNDEGIALLKFREKVVNDPFVALTSWDEKTIPCSWFGIHCANGHVVSLNLENLCLEGTLSPELRHLLHLKSIILRNNSFSGTIPKELGALKKLEVLNLAYNNFRRPPPLELLYNFPVLLLDCNGQSCHIHPELENLTILPDIRYNDEKKETGHSSRMLIDAPASSNKTDSPPSVVDKGNNPNLEQAPPPPSPPPKLDITPPSSKDSPTRKPPPAPEGTSPPPHSQSGNNKRIFIVVGSVLGFVVLGLAIGFWFWRHKKINKSGNSRGLTGQLQRAFVSGVKNLSRFELEAACEDFSNVIGTCSIGTIYKGTLSNGVEIAVISLAALSANDWSNTLATQFRKKIETLSKVNHKNFINLIGYCEDKEPFTRMMVFEYAPNGSLFEHLHVREAEHLDWKMRLRIAMGMAYCLEYMHQLIPPLTHPNLNSASIHLSDDYAAKISEFCLWNEVAALQVQPIDLANLCPSSATPSNNVYSYGLVMLEMMTGRIPHSVGENESIDDFMLLSGEKTLQQMVDPMLRRYKPDQLEQVGELIKDCIDIDPQMRPSMTDVCARMRVITGIDRDKAGPRLSPLWWAELEGRGSVTSGSVNSGQSV